MCGNGPFLSSASCLGEEAMSVSRCTFNNGKRHLNWFSHQREAWANALEFREFIGGKLCESNIYSPDVSSALFQNQRICSSAFRKLGIFHEADWGSRPTYFKDHWSKIMLSGQGSPEPSLSSCLVLLFLFCHTTSHNKTCKLRKQKCWHIFLNLTAFSLAP